MEEKERYISKKIIKDVVMPDGLFEIKDRESDFYLIIENKKDVDKITNLLNQQDKRIKELEEEVEIIQYYKTETNKLDYELRKENQQLKQQLEEKERQYETLYKLFSEQHEIIDQNELECFEEVNRLLKEQKDFYVVEKAEYDKMKQGAKDIVGKLKQQLHDLPKKIVCEISEAIERLSWRKRIYTNWEFDKEQLYKDLDTILKKYGGENESNNA